MRLNRLFFSVLAGTVLAWVASGCGSHAQKPPRPVGTVPYTASEHAGGIRGSLTFEGPLPDAKAIETKRDPQAAAIYKTSALMAEDVVVQNGRLQNAVVYLSSNTEKWVYPNPAPVVNVDIKGCRFVPRVVALTAGQKLQFTNQDGFYHAVLGMAQRANPQFNLGLHNTGDHASAEFETAEMGYRTTSDIRKWMSCYVNVFYHPFHAVTDANGQFELKNVPDGEYTLSVWHENSEVKIPPAATVTVKGGVVEQNFTLKLWSK